MAAAYGSHTHLDDATRTTTTVTAPLGTTSGDHLIIVIVSLNSGTAVTVPLPTGFTAIGTAQSGTDGSFGWRLVMGEKVSAGESSFSTTHSSTITEALLIRSTGSAPLSVDVFSQTSRVGAATEAMTAASVTTTTANEVLYYLCLNWNEVAITVPSGMTERQDNQILYFASEARATAGSTGTRAAGGTTDAPWFANLVAVKETAGGGSQGITGALYTNSQTFYGATVSPGPVSIAGSLFTNSNSFYGATVGRGAVNIGGALYSNSNSFFGGTVSASYTIQGALFTDGDNFYGATVSPGAVTISGALFSNSNSFYAATISQDGAPQNITGSLFTNAQSFYASTINATYGIGGALYSDPDTFFSATIATASPQTITGTRYDNDNRFFGAIVGGKRDSGGSGNASKRRTVNDDPDAFVELLKEWRDRKRRKEPVLEPAEPETVVPEPNEAAELYRRVKRLETAFERNMAAAEKLVVAKKAKAEQVVAQEAAIAAAQELEDATRAYQAMLDDEDEEIIALFAA